MTKKIKFSLFLSVVCIISIVTLTIVNTGTTIFNPNGKKTATAEYDIVGYGTDYIYDDTMPSTADPIVVEEGINGLSFTYDGLNYTNLSAVKNEIVKVGTAKAGTFTGVLTGYGPDCPGCSTVGNVACLTREGKRHSLITDGLYYNDSVYGSARILAADNGAFPCGTIVKINNGILPEFIGIVLDSGYTMRSAWKQGVVWMDVAYSTEAETIHAGVTSKNTKFSVQRWGW